MATTGCGLTPIRGVSRSYAMRGTRFTLPVGLVGWPCPLLTLSVHNRGCPMGEKQAYRVDALWNPGPVRADPYGGWWDITVVGVEGAVTQCMYLAEVAPAAVKALEALGFDPETVTISEVWTGHIDTGVANELRQRVVRGWLDG